MKNIHIFRFQKCFCYKFYPFKSKFSFSFATPKTVYIFFGKQDIIYSLSISCNFIAIFFSLLLIILHTFKAQSRFAIGPKSIKYKCCSNLQGGTLSSMASIKVK